MVSVDVKHDVYLLTQLFHAFSLDYFHSCIAHKTGRHVENLSSSQVLINSVAQVRKPVKTVKQVQAWHGVVKYIIHMAVSDVGMLSREINSFLLLLLFFFCFFCFCFLFFFFLLSTATFTFDFFTDIAYARSIILIVHLMTSTRLWLHLVSRYHEGLTFEKKLLRLKLWSSFLLVNLLFCVCLELI